MSSSSVGGMQYTDVHINALQVEIQEDNDNQFIHDIQQVYVYPIGDSTYDEISNSSLSVSSSIIPTAHFMLCNNFTSYQVLLDTGCDPFSCISLSLANELNLNINPVIGNIKLGDGTLKPRIGQTDELTFVISFKNTPLPLPPYTFKEKFEVLLEPYTSQNGEIMNFIGGKQLIRRYCVTLTQSQHSTLLQVLLSINNNIKSDSSVTHDLPNIYNVEMDDIEIQDDSASQLIYNLDDDLETIRPKILSSLDEDPTLESKRQSFHNSDEVKLLWLKNDSITGGITHPDAVVKLKFKDGTNISSLSRSQFPLPHAARPYVTEATQSWINDGKCVKVKTNPGVVINCPLLAVQKIAGGVVISDKRRVCADPRVPNMALTSVDTFSLPLIKDHIESWGGKKYFAEFDLENCFFQFPIHPDTQYLCFTWDGIQWRWTFAPFGISFITSHVQRFMCFLFHNHKFVKIYVDNIFIASDTWDEHIEHCKEVMRVCNQWNIKLKKSAFKLGQTKMYCLGHIVSTNGISMDPHKMQAIMDWEYPKTGEQLQSFLGTTGFVRQFIRHYADLASRLEKIKYQKVIEWNDELKEDFHSIKQAISSSPLLQYPDFNRPFYVQTDSSNTGCGAVLYQPQDGKDEITADNIVAIASKSFGDSQRKYSAYKKELYGIVFALRQFHTYLSFRNDNHVFTDHKPLTFMFKSDNLSPALQMWLDVILGYAFTIHHRPGILNVLPDALSRKYCNIYKDKPWGIPKHIRYDQPQLSEQIIHEKTVSENDTLSNIHVNVVNISNDITPLPSSPSAILLFEMEKRGKKIIMNQKQRDDYISQSHSKGHFGRDKIYSDLVDGVGVWWPNLRDNIQRVVRKCNSCMRYVVERKGYKPAEWINSKSPWEHIQIDLCLSFPESYDGYKYLLVIVDLFTSFVIVRPLKDKSANSVADVLWDVFSLFGFPKILQSDNGTEFCGKVVKEIIKLSKIDQRFIAPWNPRCDGAVENAVKIVSQIIFKMLKGAEKFWNKFINIAQLYCNNKIHSPKASMPFHMMMNRSPNLPLLLEESKSGNQNLNKNTNNNVTMSDNEIEIQMERWREFQRRVISHVHPSISNRILSYKAKMIHNVDKRHHLLSFGHFRDGSWVMIKDFLKNDKRDGNYIGPYKIIKCDQNGNYELEDHDGVKYGRRVPPDQIKKHVDVNDVDTINTMSNKNEYHNNNNNNNNVNNNNKNMEDEISSHLATMKKISKHREIDNDEKEYFVIWRNNDSPSWVSENDIIDLTLVRKYWNENNNKISIQQQISNKIQNENDRKCKNRRKYKRNKIDDIPPSLLNDSKINNNNDNDIDMTSSALVGGEVDNDDNNTSHSIVSHRRAVRRKISHSNSNNNILSNLSSSTSHSSSSSSENNLSNFIQNFISKNNLSNRINNIKHNGIRDKLESEIILSGIKTSIPDVEKALKTTLSQLYNK